MSSPCESQSQQGRRSKERQQPAAAVSRSDVSGTVERLGALLYALDFDSAREFVESLRCAQADKSRWSSRRCVGGGGGGGDLPPLLLQLVGAERGYHSLAFVNDGSRDSLAAADFAAAAAAPVRRATSRSKPLAGNYVEIRAQLAHIIDLIAGDAPSASHWSPTAAVCDSGGSVDSAATETGVEAVQAMADVDDMADGDGGRRRRSTAGTAQAQPQSVTSHVVTQLHAYVSARSDAMRIYMCIVAAVGQSATGSPSPRAVAHACDMVAELSAKYAGCFSHPSLAPLESAFGYELDALGHLLAAQRSVAQVHLLDSLIHLKECDNVLRVWLGGTDAAEHLHSGPSTARSPSVTSSIASWLGLSSSSAAGRSHSHMSLCLWLRRYYDTLLAKFTLYWHDHFARLSFPADARAMAAGAQIEPNFVKMLAAFQRKNGTASVGVLLDASADATFAGVGYTLPLQQQQPQPQRQLSTARDGSPPPSGLDTYPFLFCCPPPSDKWPPFHPAVVMLIARHASTLDQCAVPGGGERLMHSYDEAKRSTIYIARVEPRIYLVIVFSGKLGERDSNVYAFVNDVLPQLRLCRVFATLRNGGK